MVNELNMSTGGMLLRGEKRSTPGITCPCVILSNTNSMPNALGSNPSLWDEKPVVVYSG